MLKGLLQLLKRKVNQLISRRWKIWLTQPNRFIPLVTFIPLLYLWGWFWAQPFNFLPFPLDQNQISLIGTAISFISFCFLLPSWIESRWPRLSFWNCIGLDLKRTKMHAIYFSRASIFSYLLIFFILILLNYGSWFEWNKTIKYDLIIHGLLLGLIVAFAEELIFRSWLLGEMRCIFNNSKSLFIQACIFSVVHVRFDQTIVEMIGLLFGLFLLGVVLAMMRNLESGSLWGCIGFHGGLISSWFIVNSSFGELSLDAPTWIIGSLSSPNPIGSVLGIITLLLIFGLQTSDYRQGFD